MGKRAETGAEQERKTRGNGAPIPTHPGFVPIVAGWGAAFAGLALFVLPAGTINNITQIMQLGALGGFARIALTLIAALFGGLAALIIARGIKAKAVEKTENEAVLNMAYKRMRPIVPVEELGSESLDSPLVEKPFRGKTQAPEDCEVAVENAGEEIETLDDTIAEDAWIEPSEEPEDVPVDVDPVDTERPVDTDFPAEVDGDLLELAEKDICEAAAEDMIAESGEPDPLELTEADICEASPESDGYEPDDRQTAYVPTSTDLAPLDLTEADICEAEPDATPALEESADPIGEREIETPAMPESAPDLTGSSAIESLRQIPTKDLSLMQMVERFAAALHEHQEVHGPAAQPRRDAALAEALRALSLFGQKQEDASPQGQTAPSRAEATEHELRDALAKLQQLSGAA